MKEVLAQEMVWIFWMRVAMPETNKALTQGKLKNLSPKRHAKYKDVLVVVGRAVTGIQNFFLWEKLPAHHYEQNQDSLPSDVVGTRIRPWRGRHYLSDQFASCLDSRWEIPGQKNQELLCALQVHEYWLTWGYDKGFDTNVNQPSWGLECRVYGGIY